MPKRVRALSVACAAACALVYAACFSDPTAPGGWHTLGSLALDPRFPPVMSAAAASDVEPFDRVRVTVTDDDGVVRFDTVVAFATETESVQLPADVRLPAGTGPDGVTMTLYLRYINALGDTVFRGGPTRVTVRPNGSGAAPQPVDVELVHTGIGANATRIAISPSTGTAVAGTVTTFTATAFDQSGAPIPGARVVFTTPDAAAAELSGPTTGTVTWKPTRMVARVAANLLNGKADTARIQVTLPAARLVAQSGANQSATVGKKLAAPVVVRAEAEDGVPVGGVEVFFTVVTGAGALSRASAVTDEAGLAIVEWTLGENVGTQTIAVSSPGLSGGGTSISATALARIPTDVTITDGPTEVVAGVPFTVTAAIRDVEGVVVTTFNGPVSIALDPAAGPPNAALLGTVTVQAVAGIATFPDLHITQSGGGYRLVVTTGAITPANTPVAVMPGPPSALLVLGGGDQTGTVATTLFTPLAVRLTDAFGNSISGLTINFTAAGGELFAPTSGVTNAVGRVSAQVTLGTVAGSRTVRASVASAPEVAVDIAITALPGPAAAIEVASGSPQSVVLGSAFQASPLVARVVDTFGNAVSGVDVVWEIVAGDESAGIDVVNEISDDNGEAVALLNLPLSLGAIVVEASATGVSAPPLPFTVTVTTPPNPAVLYVAEFTGMSVLNLVTDSARSPVTCTISDCSDPQNIAINPARTVVAVPFAGGNTLGFLSTATGTYLGEATGATLNQPHAAAFTANGAEVWVANKFGGESDTGTVSIIDAVTRAQLAVIEHESFSEPEGIVIAGGRAFVANRARNSVTVISVATRSVIGTITFSPGAAPLHVVATPSGAFVYVSTNDARVLKISTGTLAVTDIALGGGTSRNMAVHPSGTKVYVATRNNEIAVIDVFSNAVTTISSDNWSDSYGVAISRDGLYGFVTDLEFNDVFVFSTLFGTDILASGFPMTGFTSPQAIVAR